MDHLCDNNSEPVNRSLKELADAVLASYQAQPSTRRIGEMFLPSRTRIMEIIDLARQLLFPGFFSHKVLTRQNVGYHVGNLLVRLGADLAEQINHCLCTERRCGKKCDPGLCRQEAGDLARRFLSHVPEVRRKLALDAQAAYDGDPAAKSIEEIVYCYPGFYAVTVYRIAHDLHEMGVPLMPRMMAEFAHSQTGADIHPGAKIGECFFIDHATGVVIGETSRIGNNVKIYQGVTLGAKSFPKDERGRVIKGLQRHPTIEDNVTIYPNATILGGETVVGRGATIGGNAWLVDSVAPESLVTQDPPAPKVVRKRPRRAAD
jgi:serine O-acetyltransferase